MIDDTIAAVATAPGHAGLAVVRVSGRDAVAIADRVFRGGAALAGAPANTLHHGWARSPADAGARVLDEVVVAVFRAPHSYTREDVIEISCHGGRNAGESVLAAVLAAGARLAKPGEFTMRAFLHGRLDLAQAEAVADLIAAGTRSAHDLALAQLAGALSRQVDALAQRVGDALAEIEARVDFAEDVGGIEVPGTVRAEIGAIGTAIDEVLAGAPWARAVRDGVRVMLAGRPNVGKSSLFNALLGEERAIVTALPGTTRDLLGERLDLDGVPVTLLDGAGLRDGGDVVETIGIARAREALETAPVVLWVVDRSRALEPQDLAIAARLRDRRVVVALNKSDLAAVVEAHHVTTLLDGAAAAILPVAAIHGAGLDALRAALARAIGGARAGERKGHAALDDASLTAAVSNPRHIEALERARGALTRAASAAGDGAPGEIVALELREAWTALGDVTGRAVGDDLLDRIFQRFCIGK